MTACNGEMTGNAETSYRRNLRIGIHDPLFCVLMFIKGPPHSFNYGGEKNFCAKPRLLGKPIFIFFGGVVMNIFVRNFSPFLPHTFVLCGYINW